MLRFIDIMLWWVWTIMFCTSPRDWRLWSDQVLITTVTRRNLATCDYGL